MFFRDWISPVVRELPFNRLAKKAQPGLCSLLALQLVAQPVFLPVLNKTVAKIAENEGNVVFLALVV